MKKYFFLGYPEADGGVPFSVLIEIPQGFLAVIGVMNRGQTGFSDLESAIVDNQNLQQLRTNFAAEMLHEIPFPQGFWLLEHFHTDSYPFPEYEIIAFEEKEAQPPSFRTKEYDPLRAMNVAQLMNPQVGAFFALPENILQDGIKGLILALKNKEEIQEQIIESVVDSCAEMALEQGLRERWSFALDAMSCIYQSQDKKELAQVAQDNRRAMDFGALGSQVPFVRNWSKQQLLNAMAMAQLMARES